MSPAPGPQDLPELPRDDGGPVFRAPWEAKAFALVVRLHEAGCFSWSEWAERLAKEIERARAAGDPDLGDTYYEHWLAALEGIVADKDLLSQVELARRKHEWEEAARVTPHGRPIELRRERSG
jgi:nitrile hydratase accessory protein